MTLSKTPEYESTKRKMSLSKTLEYDTGFSSIDHESTKENVDEHSPIVLEGLINRRNSNF